MQYSRNSSAQSVGSESNPVSRAFVASVEPTEEGKIPIVKIVPNGEQIAIPAEVIQDTSKDRLLPSEGDQVYYLERNGNMAVVLGIVVREHDNYDQDERFLSHPTNEDTWVYFDPNGDVIINTENTSIVVGEQVVANTPESQVWISDEITAETEETTVKITESGEVIINDGNDPVVTDVNTTTGSIDGTTVVTSVSTVTSDSLFV